MEPTSTMPEDNPPASQRPSSSGGLRRNAAGTGLLSKLSFMRSADHRSRHDAEEDDDDDRGSSHTREPVVAQQQKTRRRRGSLRKVALLGRGAQRERRDSKAALTVDIKAADNFRDGQTPGGGPTSNPVASPQDAYGLGISDITPRPSMDGYASLTTTSGPPKLVAPIAIPPRQSESEAASPSPTISYSTTDEEDVLHIGRHNMPHPRPGHLSSGSEESFSGGRLPLQRRRSQRAKSPLALTNLTSLATPLPAADGDWDYAETEWWGWVMLVVTWFVFVTGMGSCLGVWSWAWDVGTTPYAPPELEDDPTLPMVGYYPSLIILTCVMAWVWVVVAWVGMKSFRHAKISGD